MLVPCRPVPEFEEEALSSCHRFVGQRRWAMSLVALPVERVQTYLLLLTSYYLPTYLLRT